MFRGACRPNVARMPATADELHAGFLAYGVPGAALAVVRDGAPVLTYCHGMADLEWRQPVTPTTVFRLASLSKPFTALTILLLTDEGLLDPDAPITKYLPDHPDHWHGITIRHLLTHTSGIPNFVLQPNFADRTSRIDHTDADVRALFSTKPLDFQPGTRYGYSNSGYRLLDMIAARASGTKFADLLADRVFGPAGMTDSRVLTDDDIIPERASGYRRTDEGFVNAPYLSLTIPGGAGGIGSTLADLLRFDAALRHGAFSDAHLHERMFTPVRLDCGRTEGYGLGWGLSTYRGRHIKHHAGGIEGFSCLYLRIPEEDTSLIMLTNLELFQCVVPARRLIDTMLALPQSDPKPIALPEAALKSRTGTYATTTTEFTVSAAPDRLLLTTGGRTHSMFAVDEHTYVDETDSDCALRFHDDDPDEPATVTFPLWSCTGYRVPSSAYVDEP